MKTRSNPFMVCLSVCAVLTACGAPKNDVWKNVPVSRPMPMDNDSYYSQPSSFGGCATIGENPSCAGGG